MTPKFRRTVRDALLDVTMFVSFLIATAPRWSGLAIHEWLSIALAGTVIVHLLWHWQWIIQVGKSFVGALSFTARLNYLLNAAFFVSFVLLMYSGIAISEDAMPWLGVSAFNNRAWRMHHHTLSDITLIIMAIHVAVNWQWIVNLFRHRRSNQQMEQSS
jgi:hypothetical protein